MQELEIEVENEHFVNNVNYDYKPLKNKPSINNVELDDNKSLHDLGIQPEGEYITKEVNNLTNYTDTETLNGFLNQKADKTEIPTKVSQLTNDSNFIDKNVNNLKNYTTTDSLNELLGDKADKVEIPKSTSQLTNNSGYITSNDVPKKVSDLTNDKGYITQDNVPTDVSELNNDTGFITEANLPKNLSDLENDVGYAKKTEIPKNTSDLQNDSDFITSLVENLVNYYKKTDTYSKTEVNNLISSIKTVNIKKVDSLPEVGETNLIYFVPSSKAQENNGFDEYMYLDTGWEKIGTTTIDLSDYQTNEQLELILENYVKNDDFVKELAKKLDANSGSYIKNITAEGTTITITKGDDTSSSFNTQDTTYQEATTTTNGLMSAKDKEKLNGISVPTKLSQLNNDEGFITEDALPKNTSDLQNDSGFITSSAIPTEISTFKNDVGYAKKAEIPTSLSEFENDEGFLKSESDPTVPSHVKSITQQDITNWNGKANTSDIPTNISQLVNDSGFIKKDELDTLLISLGYAKFIDGKTETNATAESTKDTKSVFFWTGE